MEVSGTHEWRLPVRETAAVSDGTLWSKAAERYRQTMFGPVNSTIFSPDSRLLATTSSNHSLLLRVPVTGGTIWNEQLPRKAFSTRFRDDGRVVVSCVERRVIVRSTETAFERFFEGHTRDVRDAAFMTKQLIVSASDDSTVRFWNLASDTELGVGEDHTDYVRSIEVLSESVMVSAGYDRTVRLWDTRVRTHSCVGVTELPKQVEKVLNLGPKNLLAAAAGDVVHLLDLRSLALQKRAVKATPVHSLSIHSKTVPALAYATLHDTLVTGSFDGRVKFVSMRDGAGYAVEHVHRSDQPVTAVAVSEDSRFLAIGHGNGELQVSSIPQSTSGKESKVERSAARVTERLNHVRKLLAGHQHHRALRVAMFSNEATVIVSVLEELQRRCALHVALSGHNDRAMAHLLRFVVSHVDDPEMHAICRTTLDLLFEIYGPAASSSPLFYRELKRACSRIAGVATRLEAVTRSIGMLELALSIE